MKGPYNLTMGRQVKELLEEAISLPDADRAELAGFLLETLENEPGPGLEVAWATEIEWRVREIESGAVQTIPWEQVRAELYARLGEKP
jgi:putative addiction module component (TIGR02574 family)